MKNKSINPFDDLETEIAFDKESVAHQKLELEAEYKKRDYLIHKVFQQSEDGRELIKMWLENVIVLKPVLVKGEAHDPYDIGIAQGMQDFVRGIYLTCQRVEKGL